MLSLTLLGSASFRRDNGSVVHHNKFYVINPIKMGNRSWNPIKYLSKSRDEKDKCGTLCKKKRKWLL